MQQMNPQVKIMGISGMATDSQMVDAANAGINIFLKKPYTFRQLLHAINNLLSEP
jgi:hypothetical protein